MTGTRAGNIADMSEWFLLSVPGALLLLCGVLALSAFVESRVLSPRSMIMSAVRARRTDADYTEQFVARQFERLVRDAQR